MTLIKLTRKGDRLTIWLASENIVSILEPEPYGDPPKGLRDPNKMGAQIFTVAGALYQVEETANMVAHSINRGLDTVAKVML